MILFSHPTGNANVREAAQALLESDRLAEYWTCVSWNPDSAWNRFLPGSLRRQLARRALPPSLRNVARLYPWREGGRMAASRLGLEALIAHERGPFCIDAVYQSLDRRVARRVARDPGRLTGVYAYEDGAADTFAAAKARGLRCLYDLPIGYWRAAHAIYDEEKEREPAWACTLTGALDSPAKLAHKEEELRLADAIFVASRFTRSTLERAPLAEGKPVHIIPYGAPPAPAADSSMPRRTPGGKLKVLFVGSLGQRKGLSYLLEAAGMLGNAVELTLIGMKTAPDCAPLNEAVKRHRWLPTLPHSEVLREMAASDVLVFPSLFEGFGLVLLEALSRGLPIIATPHTAGPDLLGADTPDGSTGGFIVPIRSAQAIAEKLDLLAANEGLRLNLRNAARETALRFTWESYRARLARAIAEQMSQP